MDDDGPFILDLANLQGASSSQYHHVISEGKDGGPTTRYRDDPQSAPSKGDNGPAVRYRDEPINPFDRDEEFVDVEVDDDDDDPEKGDIFVSYAEKQNNRRYTAAFAVLFFVLAIASAVFLIGGDDSAAATAPVVANSNLALQDVGNDGSPDGAFPLGICEGDCDTDDDCQGDLFCFQRDGVDAVPGCEGEGTKGDDYCFHRPTEFLWSFGNDGSPASAFPLGLCGGDCDTDAECAGDLKCFQRSGYTAVPGCVGLGYKSDDYCYVDDDTTSDKSAGDQTDDEITADQSSQDEVFEELELVEDEIEALSSSEDNGEEEKDDLVELEDELVETALEEEVADGKLDTEEATEELAELEASKSEADDEDMEEEVIEEIEEEEEASPNLLQIRPSAITTVKKSRPKSKTGGMVNFSVEGNDERMSYVRFELSNIPKKDYVVKEARLYLYLHRFKGSDDDFKVSIDALPHAKKWLDGTVSWNEPINARGSFLVDTFEAKLDDKKKHLYEVDVTDAVARQKTRITFKLYTDKSNGRVDFAGKTYNGGDNVPELVVTLSATAA